MRLQDFFGIQLPLIQAPMAGSHGSALAIDGPSRAPFSAAAADVLEEFKPAVVSFHFGLPSADLVARVKQCGAKVLAAATTVEEARWLEQRGVDAVIAAGGISDAKGVAAAMSLGAAGVQLGTAYLLCPEATTSAVHRAALRGPQARHTAMTNPFFRPPRQRNHESPHGGARPHQRCGAGLPAGRRRLGAAALTRALFP